MLNNALVFKAPSLYGLTGIGFYMDFNTNESNRENIRHSQTSISIAAEDDNKKTKRLLCRPVSFACFWILLFLALFVTTVGVGILFYVNLSEEILELKSDFIALQQQSDSAMGGRAVALVGKAFSEATIQEKLKVI